MYVLRRLFHDGPDRPELALIHYTASPESSPEIVLARSTIVMTPSGVPGTRYGHLFLPRPQGDERLRVRYFFSTVGRGREWFSPPYEVLLPGPATEGDVSVIEEEGQGNLPPAPTGRVASGNGPVRLRRDAQKAVLLPVPRAGADR